MLISSLDAVTPLILLDRLLDLIFAGAVTLFCLGVGNFILRRLGIQIKSFSLLTALQFAVGMGAIGLALLFLGLAGLLYVSVILGVLVLGLGITFREWRAVLTTGYSRWRLQAPFTAVEYFLLAAIALLVLPMVLTSLLPPTEYDALAYHLYSPAFFLQQHAIVPSLLVTGLNYPISLDLIYLFGLAAGSDIAAQLMHLVCALAIAAALYGFAASRFSRPTGLLACVIFFSSSVIGLEASAPIIDLAWAMYEFLVILMFLLWLENPQKSYLILIGILLGFAASNKHLALVGWVLFFGLIGLVSLIRQNNFQPMVTRFKDTIVNLAIVFVPALVIVSPWWLKNALWLGNPLYPFFGNIYGLDGAPTVGGNGLSDWAALGMGHDLGALLAFPFNVYYHWEAFTFAFNRGGPTLFFLFLPLYLAVKKHSILNWMLFIAGLRFLFWFAYAQNMRYLIIIFPLLALVCAYTIVELFKRLPVPLLRPLLATVLVAFFLWGLFLQWGFFLLLREQPLAYLVGAISRNTYLEKNLLDYRAVRYMNEQISEDARILALGDSRLYYSRRDTVIDDAHANWQQLLRGATTPGQVAERLATFRITHVWVSKDDITSMQNNWKIPSPLQTPPGLFDAVSSEYLTLLYEDESGHSIYAVKQNVSSN